MPERTYSYDEYREAFMPRKCKYCGGGGKAWDIPKHPYARMRALCRHCGGTGLPGVEEMLEEARGKWRAAALHR